MKKTILLLITSCAFIAKAQITVEIQAINNYDGKPMSEIGNELMNMYRNISVGNACGVGNYLITDVPGDMNMNYHNLEILHSHITVHGQLINEGTIVFLCDTAILDFEEVLDVPEVISKIEFKVYPNPAYNDFVNVNGKGIAKISFMNMTGQIVKYYETKADRNRILIDNLSNGLYIIKVQDINDRIGIFKLIVK